MTETIQDPILEQANKIIELGKLKAELSTSFRALEQYHPVIKKLLNPTELLTEEECQIVLSKEFSKAVTGFAQSSSKTRQWHEVNNSEEAIGFLTANDVIQPEAKRDFATSVAAKLSTN